MNSFEKEGSPASSTFGNTAEHNEKRASMGGYGAASDAVPRDKLNAMFENPLAGIPRQQLFLDVDKFCADNNLTEFNEVFRKGALVAQNPSGARNLDILNDDEKRVLEEEYTHKWRHPKELYYLVIMCSLCAAVQGMDETANNGAQTFYLDVRIPNNEQSEAHGSHLDHYSVPTKKKKRICSQHSGCTETTRARVGAVHQ